MIDPAVKEELIRAQLSNLGFDLERDGFDYHARLAVEHDAGNAKSHHSLAGVYDFLGDLVRAKRHLHLAEELIQMPPVL